MRVYESHAVVHTSAPSDREDECVQYSNPFMDAAHRHALRPPLRSPRLDPNSVCAIDDTEDSGHVANLVECGADRAGLAEHAEIRKRVRTRGAARSFLRNCLERG
eukprot:6175014-Pleurochrysis_carterae.AAC.1